MPHPSESLATLRPDLAGSVMEFDLQMNMAGFVGQSAPKLVEDLVPKRVSLGVVVKVLQNLLAERVPIRNMRSISERRTVKHVAPTTNIR